MSFRFRLAAEALSFSLIPPTRQSREPGAETPDLVEGRPLLGRRSTDLE